MRTSAILLVLLLATAPAQAGSLDKLKAAIKKTRKENSQPAQTPQTPPPASTPQSTPADKQPQTINLLSPSTDDEIRIGREIAGNLLGAAPLVKDAGLQKYVNQVGRWVATQGERVELPWHFGVIESEDLNAFSAPGGWVLVTKGLYRQLHTEAELAGVLGHEIGHVIRKHHLKLLQKQQMLNVGAGMLGGLLGKDNQTVQKIIGSGAEICARSLDQDAEYEADRIGVILTARAGYDAYGLVEVLQTIGHAGSDDNRVALLFKTHPRPEDRLAKLGDAIGNRLDGIQDGKTLETRLYKLKD